MAPECDGSLLAECLLPWQRSVFILLSSGNGVSRAHIMEGNVLYTESTDLNATLIYETPSQQYLDVYDGYLRTVASPSRHRRWTTATKKLFQIFSVFEIICVLGISFEKSKKHFLNASRL